MELDIRHEDGRASVLVSGALDLSNSDALYRALAELRDDGVRRISVDVSRLDFVDSPGLGTLLRWQADARERDDEFSVHGARGLVRRVLRETGTARMLER